jgi:hypothetical protein
MNQRDSNIEARLELKYESNYNLDSFRRDGSV